MPTVILKSCHIDIQGIFHAQQPHPIRISSRRHPHPLLRAADVAVGGAIAVIFAITATTGIAGSFEDGSDVDAAVAALLGEISGELGVGHRGG